MPCFLKTPLCKRKFISVILWISFWFLCSYLAYVWSDINKNNPQYWWSALMWAIVYNRVLIWLFVCLLWLITVHPLWFRLYPVFRWFIWWIVVSLDLAIWSMILWWPESMKIFIWTIVTWWIYWMIIDLVATKFAWEGKDLLDFSCKK